MELYTNSHGKPTPPAPPKPVYELTQDPLFYGTLVFFALITTAVPAVMGQPNLMPAVQALALTVFTALVLRRTGVDTALRVVTLWLVVQGLLLLLLSFVLPTTLEEAIHDGFTVRTGLIQWTYGAGPLPGSLAGAPLARLGEAVGVALGSLATVGLAGAWFLVKGVNLLAYGAGALWRGLDTPAGLLLGLAPWRLAQLAGYAGLFVLLIQPLLLNEWRVSHYWSAQKRLLLLSAALVLGGLVAELLLPGLWRALFAPA